MTIPEGGLVERKPLYHGGVRGLVVGRMLRPPSMTGARSLADYGAGGVCRRDRVYLTTDAEAAHVYAALWTDGSVTGGAVYEVEAMPPLEPDPDCLEPGLSYACPQARIIRVVTRRVRLTPKELRRALAVIAS